MSSVFRDKSRSLQRQCGMTRCVCCVKQGRALKLQAVVHNLALAANEHIIDAVYHKQQRQQ
jgi:hypothetical protein